MGLCSLLIEGLCAYCLNHKKEILCPPVNHNAQFMSACKPLESCARQLGAAHILLTGVIMVEWGVSCEMKSGCCTKTDKFRGGNVKSKCLIRCKRIQCCPSQFERLTMVVVPA